MGSQSKRRGGGNKALEHTLPYVRPTKIRGFRLRPLPFGEGHPRVETPTPCSTPKLHHQWPELTPTRAAPRARSSRGQTGCSTPPKPQTHSYLAPPTEPSSPFNPTNTMLPPSLPPRPPYPSPRQSLFFAAGDKPETKTEDNRTNLPTPTQQTEPTRPAALHVQLLLHLEK